MGSVYPKINRHYYWRIIFKACSAALFLASLASTVQASNVAILCYHRFGSTAADSMTTRTSIFEKQLKRLKNEGYSFISLTDAINGLRGLTPLPSKPIVITVDDGHSTVYTELLAVIRREHFPVTLFIYPSAISNANYAMTWEQLQELINTPGVDIAAHTYWHPNFKIEKKRLTPEKYQEFIDLQLRKSRLQLYKKLGVNTTYMAWPFGIYDEELMLAAHNAGYTASLTLDDRDATSYDSPLALPRYLIVDATGVDGLINLLRAGEYRATKNSAKPP